MKLRPSDDCLGAQLNHAFTVTLYVKLQDIDYTTGLALKIAEHLTQSNASPGVEVLSCSLSLEKIYHPSLRTSLVALTAWRNS